MTPSSGARWSFSSGGLVLYFGHRFRRYRWPVWVVGTLGVLVLLYAFFGAVSPLLPASF